MDNDIEEKASEKLDVLWARNRCMDGLLADDPKDI